MAKMNRENAVREKRIRKAARKDARKAEAAAGHKAEEPTLETAPVDQER